MNHTAVARRQDDFSTESSAKVDALDWLLVVALSLAVSMEFVLSNAGGATVAEILIYAGAIKAGLFRGVRLRPAFLMIAGCLTLLTFHVALRGWSNAYGPYVRTFTILAGALIFWDAIVPNVSLRRTFLALLAGAGAFVAAYSIGQALAGFNVLPDIYKIGGVPASARLGTSLEGEMYRLLAVMRWKVAQINGAFGFNLLSGIGYGFHWYSQNMTEYLVFVSIAGWMTLAATRRTVILVALQTLLLVGIVFGGSRTALLGFGLVTLGFLVIRFPKLRFLVLLASVLVAGYATVLVDWSYFFFDDGGTLRGRDQLNAYALTFVLPDAWSTLFGGNAPEFMSRAASNVHNTFLYYWLYGGLLVAIPMSLLYLVWTVEAVRRTSQSRSVEEQVLYGGCAVALLWFIFYGFTWSAVVQPNTVILVALFVSIASVRPTTR